jgi:hypothetical protein
LSFLLEIRDTKLIKHDLFLLARLSSFVFSKFEQRTAVINNSPIYMSSLIESRYKGTSRKIFL